MDVFTAAAHDEVLQLVIQVALLLGAARLLGGLAQRINQPAVVGEILAGVILGPSLLSSLAPAVGRWIVPHTPVQGYLLETVGLIGVMLLLIVTGLETDLVMIRRKARVAAGVAAGGLVLPFAAGLGLGYALPADLLADPSERTIFALFVATALSISAIPVLAKVLMDLDLMRRDIGQTLLAAGMIDDITGWTLLGLVTALASASVLTTGTVLMTVGSMVLFLAATMTVGVWLVGRGLAFVQERFWGRGYTLTLVVVLAFAWGAFSHALHLEPVLGAFAIGIIFGRSPRLPVDTVRQVEVMAFAVFSPIFFATAGLKVDLRAILEPRLALITLGVIAVATFGKVVGAYLGARLLAGQDHWSAIAYGSGLNARGALEIIIATIGLSLGILSQTVFSIIVVMAIATSVMAPVALRWAMSKTTPEAEEEQRLRSEAAMEGSFLGRVRRVIIPVRTGGDVGETRALQVEIVNRLAAFRSMSVTLVTVVAAAQRLAAGRELADLGRRFTVAELRTRVIVGTDAVSALLAEAERDFDLMVLGAPAAHGAPGTIFGPVIDDLVKLAPCPSLLVRGWGSPRGLERILVPTNGTSASRRAAELAFAVAGDQTSIDGLHVVTPSLLGRDHALDVTGELEAVGGSMGRVPTMVVRQHESAAAGILDFVADTEPDLLILGTQVRAGTTRLRLGPRVEELVSEAPCPVVVLNS